MIQGPQPIGAVPPAPFVDMGTPSAPPIMENGREEIRICEDEREAAIPGMDGRVWTLPTDGRETMGMQQESDGMEACREKEATSSELRPQQKNIDDPCATVPSYHSSSHNAWQTFVAYDACFRLCLNAWARDCMEAPQFLQDECFLLRNAFGCVDYSTGELHLLKLSKQFIRRTLVSLHVE